MKFSIVVPLYNKVNSVKKTLDSILSQKHADFELIVIDDGSTDGSAERVKKINDPRLILIQQSNAGVSAARNHGISVAKYSHIAFIDADDIVTPEYLENIQKLIKTFPQAGAYCTQYQFVNGNQRIPCRIHKMSKQPRLFDNYFEIASRGDLPIVASGVCIPKYVLEEVGGFPIGQIQGEDQDLWSRIGLNYAVAVHPAFNINYQLDAENRVSVNVIPTKELAYSRNLQKMLDGKKIHSHLIPGVKRYIGGHLLHLAELNIKHGNFDVAKKFLSDKRVKQLPLRKFKWYLMKLLYQLGFGNRKKATKDKKMLVANLLNDKKMGGILSVVKSLSESSVSEQCRFDFEVVEPTSLKRKNYHADVVMVHYASSWGTLLSNLVTRILNPRSKLILQEHHYTHSFARGVPSVRRFRWMLKLNYMLFNKIVAVSKGQSDWIRSLNIVPDRKLVVIPQCRQLDDFLKVRPKSDASEIVIAAYGRLCEAKGFDTLIRAFREVSNSSLRLKIAGDGPLEQELKLLASDDTRIEFLGRVNNVPEFLSTVDLVMIPSVTEAFGLVCLEAKAAGKAVIVSDIDGLSEQVESREDKSVSQCGLTISKHSTEVISSIINKIPQFPLCDWGRNGRKQVRFAWQDYQNQWNQLLTGLIN